MGPEGAGKVNFTQVSSQGRCLAVAPGQPGGNQGCLLTCSAPERVGRPATNHSDLPEVWPPGICSLRTEPSGKSAAKAQQVFKRRVEKSEQSGGLSAGLGPSCLHSRGGRGSQVKHADSTPSRKPLTHLPSQEAQPPPIHRPPSHRELEGQDSSSHRALLATGPNSGKTPRATLALSYFCTQGPLGRTETIFKDEPDTGRPGSFSTKIQTTTAGPSLCEMGRNAKLPLEYIHMYMSVSVCGYIRIHRHIYTHTRMCI